MNYAVTNLITIPIKKGTISCTLGSTPINNTELDLGESTHPHTYMTKKIIRAPDQPR